jgi:hypothetical protein
LKREDGNLNRMMGEEEVGEEGFQCGTNVWKWKKMERHTGELG